MSKLTKQEYPIHFGAVQAPQQPESASAAEPAQTDEAAGSLETRVVQALRSVYDPELPVNIYELGLIYKLAITEAGQVDIDMTLTAPNCPVAGSLPGQVEQVVQAVPGVSAVKVNLVWDPPWTQQRLSDAAKLELGLL